MANIKKSELTEVGMLNDNDYFDIVNASGQNRKLKFSVIKDAVSTNSVNYLDIVSKDGTEYRLTLNKEGEFVVYKKEAYTGEAPAVSESGRFKGLIINQIYGGGNNTNNTPCSHHFIELYNNNTSGAEMNLKGLYISVKGATGSWTSIPLEGILPYQHSYLIRCRRVSNEVLLKTRMKVTYYDLEWDIVLPDVGFSAYLSVGIPSNDYANPWNFDGNLNKAPGYIDLLSAGGESEENQVVAYENRYQQCMSKSIGLRRLDFADTDNGQKDCRAIDWEKCNVKLYKPRCIKDGAWDVYFDKAKLKENIPNLINICYGKDGETTRTFTWETVVTDDGWLRYRKLGSNEWIVVETTRELVTHYDTDATIHRVILKNLTNGIYEYQAGEEGLWGDIATFEVRSYGQIADESNGQYNHMKVMWTSDQQGWTEEEYKAWKVCYQNIIEKEKEWDFALNTGDISQNANRSFEWRYYFKYANESTRNCCHMVTCGY